MLQLQRKRNFTFVHEDYSMCPRKVVPSNRIPSLSDLVQSFVQGRPLDQSLVRNLEFNEFERLPIFQKGLDLADLSRLAKECKMTLEDVQNEVDKAKANQKGSDNLIQSPVQEPPTSVSTE